MVARENNETDADAEQSDLILMDGSSTHWPITFSLIWTVSIWRGQKNIYTNRISR